VNRSGTSYREKELGIIKADYGLKNLEGDPPQQFPLNPES
jgi:hypothetical protein